MKTKFSKNIKSTILTCSKVKILKFPLFMFSFFMMMAFIMPISVHAGLADELIEAVENKVDDVEKKVNVVKIKVDDVQDKVNDLPGTIQNKLGIGLETELVDKVKDVITDVTKVIKKLGDDLNDFDESECNDFKSSLAAMFISFEELSGPLSGLGLPSPQDYVPSSADLIQKIPCKALVGVALVMKKTNPNLLSNVKDQITDMKDALETLLPLLLAEIVPAINDPAAIVYPNYCEDIVINQSYITASARLAMISSVALQAVASKLDPEKMTGPTDAAKLAPEPSEVDVGIHGYAHITLETKSAKTMIAKGIGSLATLIDRLQSKASEIKDGCVDAHNQHLLYARHQKVIDGQEKILKNQEQIRQLLLSPNSRAPGRQ